MYVRKYRDKWRCEVMRHGQRSSKVFDTKREAQAWGHEIEGRFDERATGFRTFAETAREYIRLVVPNKAGKVWETRRIHTFIKAFGDKALGELDAPDMSRWRDSRLEKVSASTVVREANILKHIFSTARDEWRWMENDPWRGVKLPSENPPRKARWEFRTILRVMNARLHRDGKTREVIDAFHIALRTGMRLQEVLAAPVNFDAKRQVVHVKTKTAKFGEDIPIGKKAAKLLQRPPFLVKPNEASTLFKKLTKQLLISGLTFHDTRATALTILSSKVPVEVLAKISRHKDISLLVRTYYRKTPEEISRMI